MLLVDAETKDGETINKITNILPFKKSKPAKTETQIKQELGYSETDY